MITKIKIAIIIFILTLGLPIVWQSFNTIVQDKTSIHRTLVQNEIINIFYAQMKILARNFDFSNLCTKKCQKFA